MSRLRRLAGATATACALAALTPPLAAQLPVEGATGPWRTITTPHFRLNYPATSEIWARHAAERLEAIRARVVEEVGYDPPQVVDIVASNPVAGANGEAFPLLDKPRMVLWTSPPDAESELGTFSDWTELLFTHEETHLVHLLRPSRSPAQQLIERLLLPLGPIPLKAPRWVVEGYATVIEGRLTGSGRPNGDLRAALLRRWAQAGKLPGYGPLSSDSSSYEGEAMAYLAGSAFLEWLEEPRGDFGGPGSLRKLWARMTARRDRGFDDAFEGVFGDSPQNLYDRFRAELTYRAMEAERSTEAAGSERRREGELWQDLTWSTGAPAVSPDGGRIALVLRDRKLPSRLVVWSTRPDEEAEKEWRKDREATARRDPADVPAVRSRPLRRKPLLTLAPADGVAPRMPRWMPDGRSILLVRFEPDGQGTLHPDLFVWTLASGQLHRVTRGADLRDPDPAPDGAWAVAVRDRDGLSQLVTVDLATGEVRELTKASLEVLYDRPRVSPDGRRVACASHAAGAWKVRLLDLVPRTGAGRPDVVTGMTELAPPWQGSVASPAWSHDGKRVYAVSGKGGFIDVYAFPAREPTASDLPVTVPTAVTRTRGAALSPAPTPDGSGLFYLSLSPRGLALWRQDLAQAPDLPPPPDQLAAAPASPESRSASLPAGAASQAAAVPVARLAHEVATTGGATDSAIGGAAGRVEGGATVAALPGSSLDSGPSLAPAIRPAPPPPRPPLAVAAPPESHDYGLGRQEVASLLGGSASSSGGVFELGARGGDVAGRVSYLALGALSADGWPRGGTLAGAYRGWPAALALAFFATGERPSDQSGRVPAGAGAFDLDRRGAELGTSWDRQAAGAAFHLAGGLVWEEVAPRSRPGSAISDTHEVLGAIRGRYGFHRVFGLWRLTGGGAAHLEEGRSGGASWSRFGGQLDLGARYDDSALGLSYRRDDSHRLLLPFDRYQLGGGGSSLLPPAAGSAQFDLPALPLDALAGDAHEEERAELKLGGLPLPFFYERHRLWLAGDPRGGWLSLAGLELQLMTPALPIVGLPALDLRLGAARLHERPLPHETRWWLVTVWRP